MALKKSLAMAVLSLGVGVGAIASPAMASAASSGSAIDEKLAAVSCQQMGDTAHTYYKVSCKGGQPNVGYYLAGADCVSSANSYHTTGPQVYFPASGGYGAWSSVSCYSGYTLKNGTYTVIN